MDVDCDGVPSMERYKSTGCASNSRHTVCGEDEYRGRKIILLP